MTEQESPIQTQEQVARQHRVTHRTQVLEAIHQLHSLEVRYIDIPAIMRTTGLQRGQVYDAVKDLKNMGHIANPDGRDGLYVPLESQPPSQAVSVLALAHGGVKIEKGDTILELTAHEWTYQLAPLAAGASANALAMEQLNRTIAMASRLQQAEARIKALESKQVDARQLTLGV